MDLQPSTQDLNSAPSIGKLALALSKAQAVIQNAAKSAENPAFKRGNTVSKYADLASVWDACRSALAANELAVIQQVSGGPETVTVTTVLAHSSGETISCSMTGKPTKPDVQGIGSTVTYLRRYSLASMVGVAPEDDDGNSAAGIKEPSPPAAKESVKKELERATGAGIWLSLPGDAGETHGTPTAFLDALEGHLSNADDPAEVFGLNEKTLQQMQAIAAKKKDDKNAVAAVARIKAIFDHVHAGTVPGAGMP